MLFIILSVISSYGIFTIPPAFQIYAVLCVLNFYKAHLSADYYVRILFFKIAIVNLNCNFICYSCNDKTLSVYLKN